MEAPDFAAEIQELEIQIEELETRNSVPRGLELGFVADGMDPSILEMLKSAQDPALAARTSQWTKDKLTQIQLENVDRMFGVTAFEITNDPSKTMLGLRFDVFNAFERRYTAPHYVVLKRAEKDASKGISGGAEANVEQNNQWSIFKSTLPKYIPFNELATKYLPRIFNSDPVRDPNLKAFSDEIYDQLDKIELKRSQVQTVRAKCADLYNNDVVVRCDLNVHKITLAVKGQIEIIAVTDLDHVTSAVVIDETARMKPVQVRTFEQLLTHADASDLSATLLSVVAKTLELLES